MSNEEPLKQAKKPRESQGAPVTAHELWPALKEFAAQVAVEVRANSEELKSLTAATKSLVGAVTTLNEQVQELASLASTERSDDDASPLQDVLRTVWSAVQDLAGAMREQSVAIQRQTDMLASMPADVARAVTDGEM